MTIHWSRVAEINKFFTPEGMLRILYKKHKSVRLVAETISTGEEPVSRSSVLSKLTEYGIQKGTRGGKRPPRITQGSAYSKMLEFGLDLVNEYTAAELSEIFHVRAVWIRRLAKKKNFSYKKGGYTKQNTQVHRNAFNLRELQDLTRQITI
jgi:hypothetical protein